MPEDEEDVKEETPSEVAEGGEEAPAEGEGSLVAALSESLSRYMFGVEE